MIAISRQFLLLSPVNPCFRLPHAASAPRPFATDGRLYNLPGVVAVCAMLEERSPLSRHNSPSKSGGDGVLPGIRPT